MRLGFYLSEACMVIPALGYLCMVCGQSTRKNRMFFANSYLIGTMLGIWVGFFGYWVIVNLMFPEHYVEPGTSLGTAAIYPVVLTPIYIYFYVCLKSNALQLRDFN